jgi:hypothetical protein
MTQKINHQWCLVTRPFGLFKETDFEWKEELLPELKEGEVLVRNLYLSLDPTNRGWAGEAATYMPPVGLGKVMRGIAIGKIEESRNHTLPAGSLAQGMLGWQEYFVDNGQNLSPLPWDPSLPLTAYFGLLGHIGLTAYFGLLEIGKPQPGETLAVSAAAGAVGSLVGQIGKIKGCRVVGIAGSDEKCRWITQELGFDAAINYKTEPVHDTLKKHCPGGIDVYFENVGGQILDAVLSLINNHARIALCGLISQYNAKKPVPGPYQFPQILIKRARVEGFIVLDYLERAEEAVKALVQWHLAGKLKYRVEVVEGLMNAPAAVNKLFDGSHQGKLIVKI